MKKPTIMTLLAAAVLIGSATTAYATKEITSMNAPVQKAAGGETSNTVNGTIVYNTVEVRHYTDGGAPYVFWQRTNNTDQSIAEIQFAMLAFDENGNPIKLPWKVIDSSAGYSYDLLCEWEPESFKSTEQADSTDGCGEGGWSLGWTIDVFDKDTPDLRELFGNVSYVICCDKQILFEDGTVWNNPDYEIWLDAYKGKETEVSTLQNYYPKGQKII